MIYLEERNACASNRFFTGHVLVSLIVYKTDAFEKEQRHTTAQLNAATYGERIKNEIVNGTEITDTLEQILISDDGTIKHFNTIAKKSLCLIPLKVCSSLHMVL